MLLALLLLTTSGCSVRGLAVNALADTLAESSSTFAADDDPELVRDALPFALKTIEGLLAVEPEHRGLLLAACQGFTTYSYAFVELEAERLSFTDYAASRAQKERAARLFRRARDYCFRAFELTFPGSIEALRRSPSTALTEADAEDVPLLYWTGASWGALVSASRDQPEVLVDLPAVRALFKRALVLDPDYDRGTLHEAMIGLEAVPPMMGGSIPRAQEHFERAVALSDGKRAGPYISWARQVSVMQQDRATFVAMLEKALAVDPDAVPAERLVNIISQRRARVLLAHADELFIDDPKAPAAEENVP